MTSRLDSAIKRRAIAWAGQLTLLAKEKAPKHLQPYIHSHVEEKGEGSYVIRTGINRYENQAPKYGSMDARAQEYGSGERARRGNKSKYTIRPKNGKYLIFPWDKLDGVPDNTWFGGRKLLMKNKDGNAVFHYVESPGIPAANEGKGYLAPAANELRKRLRDELVKEGKDAIGFEIGYSFKFGRK